MKVVVRETDVANSFARTVNCSRISVNGLRREDCVGIKSCVRDTTIRSSRPKMNASVTVLPTIVYTHIMAKRVPVKRTGTAELCQQIPRSIVIMGIVVLNRRIPHAAVQIEPTPIFTAAGTVVMRFIELNNNLIRVPYPNSNGTTAFIIV